MTVDVFLHDPVHALGRQVFSVEDSAMANRTLSSAPELRDAGFGTHHICGDDESVYDLALRTARALGDRLAGTRGILYSTCLPLNANLGDPGRFHATRDVKHLMDFPASRLQADLDLPDAFTVGVTQQACTGVLGSVRLARALLNTEPDLGQLLCITADRFPPDAIYEQAYNLISDGGAAWMVSTTPRGYRIIAGHQLTNGAFVQASDDESVGTFFNYTHRLFQETLQRARMTIGDVAHVVPQNMNASAWQIMSRLLGIPLDRVHAPTHPHVGHVISGDNIINLEALERQGVLRSGDRIALLMAGYGMHWQCLLIEKV